MKAVDLDWRATDKAGSRNLRSGDELFYALLGEHSRFCVAECYQRVDRYGKPSPTLYVVRDASRVTDAEVRAGGRSPVVFRSHDAQECVDWVSRQ